MKKEIVALYTLVIVAIFSIVPMSFAGTEAASAYTDNAYNQGSDITVSNKSKTISLRIEGISENIFYDNEYKVIYTDDLVTVLDAVDQAIGEDNYTALNSYYGGKYISEINGEIENTFGNGAYDGWQYRVNGESPYDTIDTCELYKNDEVVVFFGGLNSQYPKTPIITYENNNVVLEFTADGYDDNWNTVLKPIVDATVTIDSNEYTTDKDGKIYIPYSEISNKEYNIQIEKYDTLNKDGKYLPLVIRLADDYSITIKKTSTLSSLDSNSTDKEDKDEIITESSSLLKNDYDLSNEKKIFDDIDDVRVNLLVSMGVIKGEPDNKFYPDNNITRAEIITLLAKLSKDEIKVDSKKVFEDIPVDEWYYNTVMWGYDKGIITGYQNKFEPDEAITREDLAVILVNYLEKIEEYTFEELESTFADTGDMYDYSKNAVANLANIKLLNGKPNNLFDPKGYATRYETVIMLTNLLVLKYDDIDFKENNEELEEKDFIDSSKVVNYILNTVKEPTFASIGGEWTIVGLANSDIEVPQEYYETYYSNLEKVLKEANGELSRNKYTDYSRVIIALNTIEKDAQNVAGYNLLEKIFDYDKVINQGVNGVAYALMALNTGNYSSDDIEERLLEYIKENELENGGFSLGQENVDPDITAMVLQGLSQYKDDESIKTIIDRALSKLSSLQNEEGGYNTNSSESISQVISALRNLDIDIESDSRFIKNGNTLLDALRKFYDENTGAFRHVIEGEINLMATEQALIAID